MQNIKVGKINDEGADVDQLVHQVEYAFPSIDDSDFMNPASRESKLMKTEISGAFNNAMNNQKSNSVDKNAKKLKKLGKLHEPKKI